MYGIDKYSIIMLGNRETYLRLEESSIRQKSATTCLSVCRFVRLICMSADTHDNDWQGLLSSQSHSNPSQLGCLARCAIGSRHRRLQ